MNDLAHNYALALYELTKDTTAKPAVVVSDLVKLLKHKGHVKLLPDILREFEKVIDSARDEATMVLTCAKKSDLAKYKNKLKEHFGHSGGSFTKEEVDDTLIGGYVIRSGDTILDGSYKRKLLLLYRSALT